MAVPFEWRNAPEAQFAVLGDPVAHSLSPRMHTAALIEMGRPERYVAIRVPVDEFDDALSHLADRGYLGVNCTVPLKEAAYQWAETKEPNPAQVLNTLRLTDRAGINTDVPGFFDTLEELGVQPCPTLVLGAGGSARGLIPALAERGFAVRAHNRTRSRLEALLAETATHATVLDSPDPAGCGLVLNTTSAQLTGGAIPLDWTHAPSDCLVYDLFYTDGPTEFLGLAAAHGLRTVDGRPLLAAQGARSLAWWLGEAVPREAMLAAIR